MLNGRALGLFGFASLFCRALYTRRVIAHYSTLFPYFLHYMPDALRPYTTDLDRLAFDTFLTLPFFRNTFIQEKICDS